ncbi:MAG: hypothetical protein L3K19_09140 [Thermoplasmata archaeon]|nr:hypothetical protein [Thermoplasmata archaeon]
MPDTSHPGGIGRGKSHTEKAIADIVKMNPRRVTVTLTMPIPDNADRPVITLEWDREDTNMPLSELLGHIEAYVTEFGAE